MFKKIIIFLGLKGSFSWAIRKMKKGHIVTMKSVTGALRFRLSPDGENRIEWSFDRENFKRWESANIFVSDLSDTDWIVLK